MAVHAFCPVSEWKSVSADSGFVHLHVHTDHGEGIIGIGALVEKARSLGMTAVAVTDHGDISAAIEFYLAAKSQGIKPLIGCEVCVGGNECGWYGEEGLFVVLLAMDYGGYQNLCRILKAQTQMGSGSQPRVGLDLLVKHNQGLIAIATCLRGRPPYGFFTGRLDQGPDEPSAVALRRIFTDRRFYLELMDQSLPGQKEANRRIITLSRGIEIPLVVTNNCHYLEKDDAFPHEVMRAIRKGKDRVDRKNIGLITNEFYFRSPHEMRALFKETPEAITNTLAIADRCHLKFDFHTTHWPKFKIGAEQKVDEVFRAKVLEGFEARLPLIQSTDPQYPERRDEYRELLDHEMEVIRQLGVADYFLIVADCVNWARSVGIPVGPGKGDAPASLVNYCLGITAVNPLPLGLSFETFLNRENKTIPDIDIDPGIFRRREVFDYLIHNYGGPDYVRETAWFDGLSSWDAIESVGQLWGIDQEVIKDLHRQTSSDVELSLLLEQEPLLRDQLEADPELHEMYLIAARLEGRIRHQCNYPKGLVISPRKLAEFMPLGMYGDKKAIIKFDRASAEKCGLVFFDIHGAWPLDLIQECLSLIRENHGLDLDLDRINLDDPPSFALIARGDTDNVYCLEDDDDKEVLINLAPHGFTDLMAAIPICRAGLYNRGFAASIPKAENASFALLALQCAYLKAHYPEEFRQTFSSPEDANENDG